ncbi:MAG: type II toxin-antitoxin system HicB family antitoxin [Treponema sp.]|nr:type II toxin-antitoxin system HicB family antitoxin [Treponema sp.]
MKKYIALFEYEDGKSGYSVVFPDLPGCFSAGDDYDEAYRMSHEALAFHLEGLKNENMVIPEPRTLEMIKSKWREWKNWKNKLSFLVVPIAVFPASEKSIRVNIMIPEGTLRRIDAVSKNRSAFLANAAQYFLDEEHSKRKGVHA